MPSPDTLKSILTRFIATVWDDGDVDTARPWLGDTYTVHHDPGDPWDGMVLDFAGFKDRVIRSRAAFPDQRFDLQHMFADQGAVSVTWLWAATHRGDLPGFPASGQTIRMSGATVYLFEGERITGHWQIADRLGVYQQLQRHAAGGQ